MTKNFVKSLTLSDQLEELEKLFNQLQQYHKINSNANLMTVKALINSKVGKIINSGFKIHNYQFQDNNLKKEIYVVECKQFCDHFDEN